MNRKSSLLDALADRVKSPITGTITVDGLPKEPESFKRIAKVHPMEYESKFLPVASEPKSYLMLSEMNMPTV